MNEDKKFVRQPVLSQILDIIPSSFDLCDGFLACEGKLTHLGFDKAPVRSTLSDANNNEATRFLKPFIKDCSNSTIVLSRTAGTHVF